MRRRWSPIGPTATPRTSRRSGSPRTSRLEPENGSSTCPTAPGGKATAIAGAIEVAAHRRAGALLPRRPGRARRPGRGRRRCTSTPRPSTRPRCSTWSPACSACRTPTSPARCAAWAAASAARRARRRNGRRSRRSPRAATGRACKVRLDRDDDFVLTGKRHDFRCDWRGRLRRRGARSRRYASSTSRAAAIPRTCRSGVVDRTHVPLRQRLLPARRAHRLAAG